MAHGSGAWNYAVPLEETDGNARPVREHGDYNATKDARGVQRRSSAWDLMSDSEQTKQRRTSVRASNNTTAGRKRSRNQLREKRTQDELRRQDESHWIHRDKLAEIEIREMEAAGIYLRSSSRRSESAGPGRLEGRTSRSVSRSRRPASRTSHDRQQDIANDEDYAAAYPGAEESPRKRVSTVPSAPEEDSNGYGASKEHDESRYDSHFDHSKDGEFRSPEEVAAELYRERQQQAIPPRPGTSRIPVSRISPVPVPQQVVDRDSPLPRSRAGSQNWGGSFDEMQYARKARSGSVSSQVLLDSDPDGMRTTPPGSSNIMSSNEENSPPKSRVPKKAAPSGRKASAGASSAIRPESSGQKSRSASASAKRPGSSSGHKSRLSTGYYPEGDAPWISSMYKPDPRLPPDQQMLPTHKKRMMQEQWEKEGKTGTVYDRDFRLLNDEEYPKKPPVLSVDSKNLAPPPRSPSPQKDKYSPNGSANSGHGPLSPLSPKSDGRSESGSVRPGTSGGYKITPTIPSTPTFQRSPLPSPAPQLQPPMAQNTTTRIPDLDEKDEPQPSKKKACCCIVM